MTQETIELKLKMTLEKLKEAGFDITRTANDMKFQENIEDYEEIYNSLSSHIECLKGINRLKVIERKIETSDILDLVGDIIDVIRIFRENRKTLKENKNVETLESSLYEVTYKIITREVIENLSSDVLNVILESDYDSLRISKIIYNREIPNIKETEYNKDLIEKLNQKISHNNKSGNIFLLDSEIMLLVVSIFHTQEVRKSSETKLKKLLEDKREYLYDLEISEDIVDSLSESKEEITTAIKKNNRKIKVRIFAFLASLRILTSVSSFAMKKLEKGYLKYETTMTYAYEKDGELTINPSSTEIFSKVADDEQAILSVFYEPFETTTGTKQFVEKFSLPPMDVEDIEDYIDIDTSTLTFYSQELKDKDIKYNSREIFLQNQNLDNPITDEAFKIFYVFEIVLVSLIASLLPYFPINDILELLISLSKERKSRKESYFKITERITDYLNKMDKSLLNAEKSLEIYNALKELSSTLKIDFQEDESFENLSTQIELTKEHIRKLQNNK